MRCPIHVAREMVAVEKMAARHKRRKYGPAYNEQEDESANLVPLRCVVRNCYRVGVVSVARVHVERKCPICKNPTESLRGAWYDHRCRACLRANRRKYSR